MIKLLADWLPILLFFVAYKLSDLYVATGVAIVATMVLMLVMRLRGMAIDKMQWVSLGLIVVFGGATILLHDERFIKLKPTLLYGLFALALLIPQLFFKTRLIEKLLKDKVSLPDFAWSRLNAAWGIFFAFMAALNLYVAATFSTDLWVDFKLFGTIGLLIAFVIAQGFYMSRFAQPEDPTLEKRQP